MKRPLKYQRVYSLIKKHRCAQTDVDSGGKYGNIVNSKNGVKPDARFGQKCGEMSKM